DLVPLDAALLVDQVDGDLIAYRRCLRSAGRECASVVVNDADLYVGEGCGGAKQDSSKSCAGRGGRVDADHWGNSLGQVTFYRCWPECGNARGVLSTVTLTIRQNAQSRLPGSPFRTRVRAPAAGTGAT